MNVLVATDGSASLLACVNALAGRSLPWATRVRILSVLEEGELSQKMGFSREKAMVLLNNASHLLRKRKPEVDFVSTAVSANLGKEILDELNSFQAEMLFTGAHTPYALPEPIYGNVANELLHNCPCSITVIQPDHNGRYKPVKRHLICVDNLTVESNAFLFKRHALWPSQCEFMLFHVVEIPSQSDTEIPSQPDLEIPSRSNIEIPSRPDFENRRIAGKIFQKTLKENGAAMSAMVKVFKEQLTEVAPGAVVHFRLVSAASVVEAILDLAKSWKADLITLNPRRRSIEEGFWQGSVADAIAQRATCSVEIVRSDS